MEEGERTAPGRAGSLDSTDSPRVVRWMLRSPLAAAVAKRSVGWLAGHPGFDAAMQQGRPFDALSGLIRTWARTIPTRRVRARLAAPNPVGFPQQHSGRVVVLDESFRLPMRTRVLQRAQAVVLDRSCLWPAPEVLVELAASGVPLVCESGDVPGLLDEATARTKLRDVRTRELHSVRLRRRALAQLYGSPGEDTISVVLATRRPDDLPEALAMIDRQVHPPSEVLVGLHGDAFSADIIDRFGGPDRVFFRFDAGMNLGEVLAELTRHSTGRLVTKWDDDDVYGCHHLQDLAMALRYSGADLVGKAAEFVHLETLGITVRRMSIGAESFSPTLAGGTLMVKREALDRAGGWPLTPRNVDFGLIERLRRSGGRVYRTHGFEYVLRRSDAGHTWSASVGYFLDQSTDQRAGLDLGFAGFDHG